MNPQEKNIMSYESVLPPDFNGTFPCTNYSKEDFVGVWGGKEYFFPAESTVNLLIMEHSPLEVQHIRKKLGMDLAVREWFKSKGYETARKLEGTFGNRSLSSIHQANTYTVKDLEPFIKRFLEPMAISPLLSKASEKDKVEDKLHRKDDGNLATEVVDNKTSLRKRALEA